MTKKKPIFALLAVLALLGLVSCGGGGSSAKARPKKQAVTTSTTTTSPPEPVAPETGLPDPGGQSLTRPALWVKIENTPPARPQAGLSAADVVYEQETEGGVTRFVALFNSQIPDVIGPVRSVRVMDPDTVSPLGGIFVYSGGIPETVALIDAAPVNAVEETKAGDAMFRDVNKSAPHNLYGHGPALLALGGQPVPPPPLFQYLRSGDTFAGDPVDSMTVNYQSGYGVSYTHDAASNTWRRVVDGAAFVDASGQQIAPANVIVQFVQCCVDGYEGARYETVGSGEAWVFSAGKLIRGGWRRDQASQTTQFTAAFGVPVRLTPGRTWVEYVPVGETVDVTPTPAVPASTTATPSTRTRPSPLRP